MKNYFLFFSLISGNTGVQWVQRKCVMDENVANALCQTSKNTAHSYGHMNVEVKCVTCDTDGCNGATKYGPIAVLIVLPVAIAKIFKLF